MLDCLRRGVRGELLGYGRMMCLHGARDSHVYVRGMSPLHICHAHV